ncbi:MAG TPA: adenosylcobinamide-GDP ribazoletransferase [Actinomycetes bacterium]|nr:adenosylcobinamide-GDP ribazoletransferase [Actinomycetes bacterium]
MDAVRLAVGTFTLFPVSPPRRVEASTWRAAITLAPVVGVVLGLVSWVAGRAMQEATGSVFVAAVFVVVALAVLTRGLHLDGLADVADGLGSRRPPRDAQAVMRQSDVGPFGVVTLVLTLLVQVAVLQVAFAWSDPYACAVTVTASALVSRAALVLTCRRGVPPAADGMGAHVVGSVSRAVASLVAGAALVVVVVAGLAVESELALWLAIAALGALAVAELWWRHCAQRLGAVTGDVLGSLEQLNWTTFLVVAVLLV